MAHPLAHILSENLRFLHGAAGPSKGKLILGNQSFAMPRTLLLVMLASVSSHFLGQTITFYADSWPDEVTDIWVIHEGDTLYEFSTSVIANELFSGPNTSSPPFNLFYTGAFQVVAHDSFGDGGLTFSIDPGAGNSCLGDCSPVSRYGATMV